MKDCQPWEFRVFPDDLVITAEHRPSGLTLPIRSFEQYGGIVSGIVRRRKSARRARQARDLYRRGYARDRVVAIVGISLRSFFRYVSTAWDWVDSWRRNRLVPRTLFTRKAQREKVDYTPVPGPPSNLSCYRDVRVWWRSAGIRRLCDALEHTCPSCGIETYLPRFCPPCAPKATVTDQ